MGSHTSYPFFFLIKSMRDQQHKKSKDFTNISQISSTAVKILAVSFPVVLGLHLMIITLCTLLVKVCARHSILSSYFLIGIRSGSFFLVFVSNIFFLLEIGLTVMSFKWSPECKNMLHGFSPRSPEPSVVSTHLKLSFRWGE